MSDFRKVSQSGKDSSIFTFLCIFQTIVSGCLRWFYQVFSSLFTNRKVMSRFVGTRPVSVGIGGCDESTKAVR